MKGKKLLAGVLSAAMVLGTMALPVFADGEATELPAADENGVITLTEDVTLKGSFNISGNLDLGGHILTIDNVTSVIENGTIKNGTIKVAQNANSSETMLRIGDYSHASLEVEMKDVTIDAQEDYTAPCGLLGIYQESKLTLNHVTINVGSNNGVAVIYGNDQKADLIANDINITAVNQNKLIYGVKDADIKNMTFKGKINKELFSVVGGKVKDSTFTYTNAENEDSRSIASDAGLEKELTFINTKIENAPTFTKGAMNNTGTNSKVVADDLSTVNDDKMVSIADAKLAVAQIGDKYYTSIDDAVKAAQAATTDKYSTAKITLLTNDALDISKGPDNYVSYNITKNDTVVTGERIAHKEYNEITNASKLYIPADVNSLILEDVKNLCSIEIAQRADVTLKLNGNNELVGNIFVPEGAKLTIEDITADGTGRLAVYNSSSAGYSAAIGGGQAQSGGEIVIKSSEIEAYSTYGAAIGGGQQSTAKVTILGGKIKAEAGSGTAIGGGQQSTGDVTISGGVIDAKSDKSAPIGGGQQAAGDSKITISGGDITVARKFGTNLFGNSKGESAGAKISGGTFNVDVTDYCEEGFTPKLTDGKYVVDDSATKLTLGFKKTATDERVYDIVVTAVDAAMINRLNTAELTFNLTASDAANSTVTYEILPVDKITVTPDNENTNRYMFNFNGKDGVTDTANEITVGQVRFEGYTKNGATITFKTDMAKSFVTATTKDGENVVTYFDGNGTLTADDANKIEDVEFTVPTKKLTVNITFPNAIADQAAAYQDMKVVVSGSDLAENLEYALGTGENAIALENGAYKLVVDGKLTENTAYTVTVSGAGYRTARYTVTMTDDKTLNFWNNAKDTPAFIEEGKGTAKETNFLAGDIVKDGKINIYDLSAVVSYFGTNNLVSAHPEYAKYDLNRDGKIDSKDVAYVLVSWGK